MRIRADTESIPIDDDSIKLLSEIGDQTTLRYAVQLLTPSFLLARINGKESVTREEVEEIQSLFRDAKTSARVLQEKDEQYLH